MLARVYRNDDQPKEDPLVDYLRNVYSNADVFIEGSVDFLLYGPAVRDASLSWFYGKASSQE